MDGYQIVSEVILGNPNVDMLIIKPYLYVYVGKDEVKGVKKKGISTGDDGVIQAFFARLPEKEYSTYLKDHVPVKISVAKLAKVKDQKVVIKPVNFEHEKDTLTEDDIQELMEKDFKKFLAAMRKSTLEKLPRVDINFSNKIVPAFTLKVLSDES
jgi:hypothetical protein